jgi:ubiquinone/menaquinone biosynthesis C-methylase UbiE
MGKHGQQPESNWSFRMMSLIFWFRDRFSPPERVVQEAEIRPGFSVLDYGCGPGGHALAAAKIVGATGKVYALDVHPLAIDMVKRKASKRGFTNVETIHSDCATELPGVSLDTVLLYDTFHDLERPSDVLKELHRVLKPGGVLSFSDHHLKEDEILAGVTAGGLFRLDRRGGKTYTFSRA